PGQRQPVGRGLPGALLRRRLRARGIHAEALQLHRPGRLGLPHGGLEGPQGLPQLPGHHPGHHRRPLQCVQLPELRLLQHRFQDRPEFRQGELRHERRAAVPAGHGIQLLAPLTSRPRGTFGCPAALHPRAGARMPSFRLRVAFLLLAGAVGCNRSPALEPDPVVSPRQQAFLDPLERRTFNCFWERTSPATGLTPDRWPSQSFSSIAAVGFALTAYPIGAERGYVSRDEAAGRTLTTLRWFWAAPQGPAPSGTS